MSEIKTKKTSKSSSKSKSKSKPKSKSKTQVKIFDSPWYVPGSGPPASKKVFISNFELRELIAHQLGAKIASNFGLYLGDHDYYCTPLEDAKTIIKSSKVAQKEWVEEKFDCDDFAHVLKSNFSEAAYKDGKRRLPHCFGTVWGHLPDPHAMNWMVNSDLKLRFVEPMNGRSMFPRKSDDGIYFMLA